MGSKTAAAINLPIGLIIILIITMTSLGLFSIGLNQFTTQQQYHQLENTLDTIISTAETMAIMAKEESHMTVEVHIPQSIDVVIFGNHPHSYQHTQESQNNTRLLTNCYGYITKQGTMKSFYAPISFTQKNAGNATILHQGTYQLTLKLNTDNEEPYVSITPQ